MKKTARSGLVVFVLIFMAFSVPAFAGAELSLKEILEQNVQAAGGLEKLKQIQNFSFQTGITRSVVSSKGELKLITGKDPVVTEVVLVKGDQVRKNSFHSITDVTAPENAVYGSLARLYAGLFSLWKFEGQLKLEGTKAYGSEKFYHLATMSGPVKVGFFLRTEDFLLRRLVFEGLTAEGEKYEVNYDFAPFEETEGLMIPRSWFSSQVGTRGNLAEVAEVKTNQPLPQNFFDSLEINIGTTEASPGALKGNILDFSSSPFGLTINTNWTGKDIDKAGFRTGDRLAFLGEGIEAELVFYSSAKEIPPENELAKGARLLMPLPRGGYAYVILFIAVDTAQILPKLKPLAPIEIRKK